MMRVMRDRMFGRMSGKGAGRASRRFAALLTAAAMVAMSLSGCAAGGSGESAGSAVETAGEEGLDRMVFTYVTSPLNVPSIVEKEKHMFAAAFEDMGTSVEYAELTSGADQTQALASGDVQVLYAVGATSVILAADNGADVKVLNMYSRSPGAFCLYSRDESLATPESLRGKTIAGPVGTNLHELLAAYLAGAGMTVEDVNFVNMSIPDAKAALDGGSIDAALIAGATAYQAEQQGYHLVADGEGLIDALIAVAVSQEFYEEHPETIKRLEQAQEEIAAFMEENHQETMELTAAGLDLDIQAVEDMYGDYDFSTGITPADREGFQKTADFMAEAGMIEAPLDVEELFLGE